MCPACLVLLCFVQTYLYFSIVFRMEKVFDE